MIHSPALARRYGMMRRGIAFDSLCVLIMAALAMFAGWAGQAEPLLAFGVTLAVIAVGMWIIRSLRIGYRARHTPTMLFINMEGITGVMPNTRARFVRWHAMQAHALRLAPRVAARGRMRAPAVGLLLRGERHERFYVTRDLEGFDELLDVLVDMDVPVHTAHGFAGLRSSRMHQRSIDDHG